MRLYLLVFLLLPFSSAFAKDRCKRPADQEPVVYSDDFKRMYTLEEMAKDFEKTYYSGKRLKGRAYWDDGVGSYVLPLSGGLVKIDETFIRSVTRHVEIALERRYADFIFFPDIGHSHLHIPVKDLERLRSVDPAPARYEGFFAYRELKMLYHTAEKLQVKPGERSEGPFPQDPLLLWRYFSRNPVGDNNGGENVFVLFNLQDPSRYNTVKEVPGHGEYSAGFDISASKDGCFPYQHKGNTFYFDLSLESLPCQNCADHRR